MDLPVSPTPYKIAVGSLMSILNMWGFSFGMTETQAYISRKYKENVTVCVLGIQAYKYVNIYIHVSMCLDVFLS